MKTPEQFPSIYDTEGRIDDPGIAHRIADIEDKGHLPLPTTLPEKITHSIKKRLPRTKERLEYVQEVAQFEERKEQDLVELKYEQKLAVEQIQSAVEAAVAHNSIYNLKDGKADPKIGSMNVSKSESPDEYKLSVMVEHAEGNPQLIYEVKITREPKPFLGLPDDRNNHSKILIAVFDHRKGFNQWPRKSGFYDSTKEGIIETISEEISTFRVYPTLEEKMHLRRTDILKNPEDSDNIAEWFKAEAEDSLGGVEDPSNRIADLAEYVVRRQGKEDISDSAKKFIKAIEVKKVYHAWDSDEVVTEEDPRAEDTPEYTHGNLKWFEEQIFEYCYRDENQDYDYGGYEAYVYKWDDEGLKKAIEKWMDFLKSLPPSNLTEN